MSNVVARVAPGQTRGMGELDTIKDRPFVLSPFGKALIEVASTRPNVIALTADLGKYTDLLPFATAFPERYFDIGMMEQQLVAMAAGLARTGKIPYITTYGAFATRRAYDFIAMACAHSNLPVKIFAALPGVTTGYGGTHQAIEDTMLMRGIPGLAVIDPCDANDIVQVTHAVADYPGPVYVRLQRGNVPLVLPDDYEFVLGKSAVLHEGSELGIISTGLTSGRALEVAQMFKRSGVGIGVLHVPTLKPFDARGIVEFASSFPKLITFENHLVSGGLGSQVTEALYDAGVQVKLKRIGLPDKYLECGSVPYLEDKYGLSSGRLREQVELLLNG
jgi:transketolase